MKTYQIGKYISPTPNNLKKICDKNSIKINIYETICGWVELEFLNGDTLEESYQLSKKSPFGGWDNQKQAIDYLLSQLQEINHNNA